MRALGPVAVAALTLTMVGATSAHAGQQRAGILDAHNPDRVPGEYVVVLKQTTPLAGALRRAERAFGASVGDVYRTALKGYSAHMTPSQAQALAQLPGVETVQADTRVHVAAQSTPTGVRRVHAPASPTAAINRVDRRVNADVAVIDTGVDLDHPDLNVYRRGASNCSSTSVGADDRNGHGTHVSGTIAALDNRRGVVGVAPGARIWPVRVLGADGFGTIADVICGIDYVTLHAKWIEVANMSLSTSGGQDDGRCGRSFGDALHQAVCASVDAGVTYVVAAGNSDVDAAMAAPASYDEVITVSALADFNGRAGGRARPTCRADVDDTFADFSNYGPDVDLAAPGVCIRSTWKNGRYATLSGTSMASPHVAGAAALYLSRHPAASPARVRSALRAAGSMAWNDRDDPDRTQEPLLDVTGY